MRSKDVRMRLCRSLSWSILLLICSLSGAWAQGSPPPVIAPVTAPVEGNLADDPEVTVRAPRFDRGEGKRDGKRDDVWRVTSGSVFHAVVNLARCNCAHGYRVWADANRNTDFEDEPFVDVPCAGPCRNQRLQGKTDIRLPSDQPEPVELRYDVRVRNRCTDKDFFASFRLLVVPSPVRPHGKGR